MNTNLPMVKQQFIDWLNNNRISEAGVMQGSDSKMAHSVELMDGTTMSIQASRYHHCYPRATLRDYAEYESFEVGFPSKIILEFFPYIEDEDRPTNTVYNYVPAEVIQAVIDARGGIKGQAHKGKVVS